MSGVVPTLTANMGEGGHNVPLVKTETRIRKLTPTNASIPKVSRQILSYRRKCLNHDYISRQVIPYALKLYIGLRKIL